MTRSLIRVPRSRALSTDTFRGMERLFNEFLRPTGYFGEEELGDRSWAPAVDILETADAYQLMADLPGLTKDDVELTFENNVLNLRGERKFEDKKEGENFHRIERSYGAFTRSFVLPTDVDTTRLTASFDNGQLTIEVPKAEQSKPRKIDIS